MDDFEKEQHNLAQLTTANERLYLYIPVQFGHLSKHKYRVNVVDEIKLKDGDKTTHHKRLKVYKRDGKFRELHWQHRKLKKDYKGTYWEYMLAHFDKEAWHELEQKKEAQVLEIIEGKRR